MKSNFFTFFLFFLVSSTTFNRCTEHNKKYILITMLYNEKQQGRMNEYLSCLKLNLTNDSIEIIHFLYDVSSDDMKNELLQYLLTCSNVTVTYIQGRATYQSCFELANNLYPHQNVIVSNADVYFNETLSQLDSYDLKDKFLALTRWDVNKDKTLTLLHGTQPVSTSQDTWIFQTPIKTFNANIPLGVPGCDNAIAYRAQEAQLQVINPCLTIQCCHLHLSDIRNYSVARVVPPPYLALPITTLPHSEILRCQQEPKQGQCHMLSIMIDGQPWFIKS